MSPESQNKQKFESFFKEEYIALKHFVSSRIKASTQRDPEDIIQDVAYNLFAGADGYGPISNVAGFVYRSLKNKIIDSMRKRNLETVQLEENESKWMGFVEFMYGESEKAYSTEMIKNLQLALKGLSPPDYAILMAVDYEGYSYREISEETGTSEGTLMSRRHRALSKLNKTLIEKRKLETV